MRRISLRGWLLVVSLFFSLLVVGGIALTTYVIIADGMQVVVQDTAVRIANGSLIVVENVAARAEVRARAAALSGPERRVVTLDQVHAELPALLNDSGLKEAGFALYDSGDRLIWESTLSALHPDMRRERQSVRDTGAQMRSSGARGSLLTGLVSEARLSAVVVHLPVELPFGERGIMDVTYIPDSEEKVIDSVRLPMTVLALSAMLIMVVLMQTSMAWVLKLVDDLRQAADSIDAGRLDERLPDEAQNEIGELARSINRLIERLRRRSDAQARFVADASHELATPVAGIRGYTSILRAWGSEDPTVTEEAIDAIDRESRRMARLTSDLLNILHADQGLRLATDRFDLNVVVRERLAITASRYLDKGIEFVGPEEESLLMVGDPERLEDVISILLDNASKYTPASGSVTVTTQRRRDTVMLMVTDTGSGIAPEDVDRVFDRFFRSDKARAEGEGGFGLGLAIAKGIVESMGGTIAVWSTLGEGTSFQVTLPRGRF